MVDIYYEIVNKLILYGRKEGQLLVLKNFTMELDSHEFSKYPETLINIEIPRKLKYITKTYWNGQITKVNPCISKITNNTIHFRSSRLFPTLYLDLIIITQNMKGMITLQFDKLFIGYHCLSINTLYPELTSTNFEQVLQHWKIRFQKPQQFGMLKKYQQFLLKQEVTI